MFLKYTLSEEHFSEGQNEQPGVPLVRLTLKTRSLATAAASREFLHASTA